MNYTVTKLYDDSISSKRFIVVQQNGKNRLTCLVNLRKPGTKTLHQEGSDQTLVSPFHQYN